MRPRNRSTAAMAEAVSIACAGRSSTPSRADLRRRRLFAVFGVPLGIAVIALLVGFALYRGKEKQSDSEREPNDSPAQATLLALDRPIEGRVGKGLGEGAPDLDYFRIPFSKQARSISARLEGVPGVDLVLELFDAQGTALAKCDARGAGGGEWLQPTRVGLGEAFLLVRQLWTQGAPLVEDVADAYKLTVHFGALQPGWEVEPNDGPSTATPFLTTGRRMRGYLGTADDRDWYSFESLGPGTYIASVTAPTGVDVVILTVDDGRPDSAAPRVAKRVGAGEREQTRFEVRLGKPSYLGVARKAEMVRGAKEPNEPRGEAREAKEGHDPKEPGPVGLDDPYEITIAPAAD